MAKSYSIETKLAFRHDYATARGKWEIFLKKTMLLYFYPQKAHPFFIHKFQYI